MLRKVITVTLFATQIWMASMGCADSLPTTQASQTPEVTLLASVIGLQGLALSKADLQTQITAAYTRYSQVAPIAGRQDRLRTALITMHISTPAQAQAFSTGLQAASVRLSAANLTSTEQAQQLMSSELQNLVKMNAQGAEYSQSTCDLGTALGIGGMGILLTGVAAQASINGFSTITLNWTSDLFISGAVVGVIGAVIEFSNGC